MAAKKDDIVIELGFERDTKRTFVFKSADEDDVITSLYVQKKGFAKGAPKKVRVTVEAIE